VGARNMVYNLSLPDLIENEQEVISSFVIERYCQSPGSQKV
jgi:hypothetical protein